MTTNINKRKQEEAKQCPPPPITLHQSMWILVGKIIILKLILLIIFVLFRNTLLIEEIASDENIFWVKRGGLYLFFEIIDVTILSYLILKWYSLYYIITPKKITIKSGIFIKKEEIYSFSNLENIKLRIPVLGFFLRYGNIQMIAPILQKTVNIKNIKNPKKYIKTLEKYINNEKPEQKLIYV